MKPASIRKFDWLYLASVAISIAVVVLSYDQMMAQVNAELATQGARAEGLEGVATGALMVGILFGFGISLLLWALISIWRVEFVKWILILFIGWGLVSSLTSLGTVPFDLMFAAGLLTSALSVVAVWFLFQPDAKAWFARREDPTDTFE